QDNLATARLLGRKMDRFVRLFRFVGHRSNPAGTRGRPSCLSEWISQAVITIYLTAIIAIKYRLIFRAIAGRLFENRLIEIDDISALIDIIGEHVPRERIIVRSKAEQP